MTAWQGTSWATTLTVAVSDPDALPAARRLVLRTVRRAASVADLRTPQARVHRLDAAAGHPLRVGDPLAALVAAALGAAERTAGLFDPTVGSAVVRHESGLLPAGKDLSLLPRCGSFAPRGARSPARPVPGWRSVHCAGRLVTLPAGVLLDLTAVAKAAAAEQAAAAVWRRLGVGVLVELGGDVATAGTPSRNGWGTAVPGATVHRPVIDPRTGAPAPGGWRSVSVPTGAGVGTLVEAKALAVAAAVLGPGAPAWLDARGVRADLVGPEGQPAVRKVVIPLASPAA